MNSICLIVTVSLLLILILPAFLSLLCIFYLIFFFTINSNFRKKCFIFLHMEQISFAFCALLVNATDDGKYHGEKFNQNAGMWINFIFENISLRWIFRNRFIFHLKSFDFACYNLSQDILVTSFHKMLHRNICIEPFL